MFTCSECRKPATWRGEWSDRDGFVCDDHRDYLRWCHDNDHIYDATGIIWESSSGVHEYERRSALPLKEADPC